MASTIYLTILPMPGDDDPAPRFVEDIPVINLGTGHHAIQLMPENTEFNLRYLQELAKVSLHLCQVIEAKAAEEGGTS